MELYFLVCYIYIIIVVVGTLFWLLICPISTYENLTVSPHLPSSCIQSSFMSQLSRFALLIWWARLLVDFFPLSWTLSVTAAPVNGILSCKKNRILRTSSLDMFSECSSFFLCWWTRRNHNTQLSTIHFLDCIFFPFLYRFAETTHHQTVRSTLRMRVLCRMKMKMISSLAKFFGSAACSFPSLIHFLSLSLCLV